MATRRKCLATPFQVGVCGGLSHHILRRSTMDRLSTLAIVLFLAFPVVARGQALRSNAANPDSALQTILRNLEGTSLSLHDAVQLALENATAVRTAEAAYQSARGVSRREAGAFDPSIFFSINQLTQDQPTASFFSGASVLSTKQTTS